jgi:phosphate transport system protein
MPRITLDRQIHHLQDEILLMGSMVEKALLNAVNTLKKRDIPTAIQLYEDDSLINDKRFAIENAIIILLATQQPFAHDLRILTAMLEISTELERMGDYAKGIAKITINLEDAELPIPVQMLTKMAELVVSMLHRAISAFISENVSQASQIPLEDDEVDDLFNNIYRKTVNSMIENPSIIDQVNLIQWAAHNLERTADRVTNICERTVFIATGEMLEIDTSEDSSVE